MNLSQCGREASEDLRYELSQGGWKGGVDSERFDKLKR